VVVRYGTVLDLRRGNRSALMRALYFNPGASRHELGVATALSAATVSNVVNDLMSDGLVIEAGAVSSDGGRPRTLIRVNPAYGYVIGVDIGETRIRVELFELTLGAALASADALLEPAHHDVDVAVRDLVAGLAEVMAAAQVDVADVIGIGIGAVSGYSGHSIDRVLMGITDGMMALPTLILILAARAAFPLELSPLTAAMLLVAIFALTGWAEMARLTRGLAFSAKQLDFVLAARAAGASEPAILFRHVMPNIAGPLVVQGTLMLASFLLAETALSFLGVGLQEPEPSLGNMLSAAADLSLLRNSPMLSLAPAAVIFLYVLAVHLIGRGRQSDNLRNGA
jgi:ABC-type dipeptide/oligopeptide/nickel transport system permease subunit